MLVVAPGVTAPAPRAEVLRSRAAPAESSSVGDDGATDYQAVAASLNALLAKSQQPGITGKDLRNLVMERFGRSYDIRLARLHGRMYLQVMWRFLEQKSFPLSPEEYMQQLDAVAEYLNDWGMADTARQGIMGARKPPGYTGGGNARCISIPLPVDLSGARGAEWQ
ncbi:hypothetical protein HYH03_005910 [Edaphochlamys debaryana]|uniref:DUF3067 family protein n=1 Tax=Edaphochlamys debaryana TaxID=47281 RepID=A0A835Y757_9CHLO|nr:hypothetical protein HYH03_005910 [Edaphochlamys debaryana]|eukprot:KAG2495983.1 hypothetical protein HYH03_005910 [Edaphochlamys debaryana]